eukprot:GFUD01037347.1.p1 GENE.GFUD01037347.1~~GFUD01037347.1.p1  ORF type:complete len:183 (+),score=49.41 GFUD01037347.1:74-622(+)
MMKAFLFISCVALASAQLEYGFCDGSAEPASIDMATVDPFPVVLATGETVSLSVQLTLNEPIPVGAQVSLKIKKEGIIPIPFPCIEVEGLHLGSCDYDGDHLLEIGADALCPTYFPEGQECMLPLNPGVYGAGEPLVITFPEIPALIAELLATGTYYAQATITLADGTEMACIYIRVELVAE